MRFATEHSFGLLCAQSRTRFALCLPEAIYPLFEIAPYSKATLITEGVSLYRKSPLVSNPPRGKLKFLIYRLVSSLKVCHSTVKAPWVNKPRSGFSLAEVLVVGVVGSVILAGSLQSLSVTVQSSQVIRSSLVEKDFVKSVGKIVSAPALCKANFKPATGKIEGTYGTGTITTLTDKVCKYDVTGCTDTSQNKEYPYSPLTTCKVASDCPEPSHTCTGGGSSTETKKCVGAISITSEDDTSTSNVKEYEFKNALEIISLELTADEDPAEPPKGADKIRTFSVFYKKLGMGQLTELIPGQCERKIETTPAKTDGCYSHQCKIMYELNDAGTAVLKCEALDCIAEGMSYECSGGMVRNDEDTGCICPDHTPNWNGTKCINCATEDKVCKYEVTGCTDTTENKIYTYTDDVSKQNESCTQDSDCTKGSHTCTGGGTASVTNKCKSNPWWNGAECDECPSNLIFSPNNRKCEACSAPTPKPNRDTTTDFCEACPATTPPTPWWNNGTCKACPDATPKYKSSDNTCEACPSTAPKYKSSDNTCEACPSTTPKYKSSDNTCEPCPSTAPKYKSSDNTCEPCPSTAPKYKSSDNTCEACPSTAPKYKSSDNTCEPCPSHQRWEEGVCEDRCTFDHRWTGSQCDPRCNSPEVWDGNQCVVSCESGKYWNGSQCVCSTVRDCIRLHNYNTRWNTSTCSCELRCSGSRPAWDYFRQACRTCYEKNRHHAQTWSSRHKKCITCVRKNWRTPYWNNTTRSCEACPSNNPKWSRKPPIRYQDSFYNYGYDCRSSCLRPTPLPHPTRPNWCTGCHRSTPKYNSTTRSCEACPDATPIYKSSNNTCTKCTFSAPKWNGQTQRCEDCPSHRPAWSSLPTGVWTSPGFCRACYEINIRTPKWDSGTRTCKSCYAFNRCKPKWNRRTQDCEACPLSKPKWSIGNRKCRSIYCPSGTNWNSTTCTCE